MSKGRISFELKNSLSELDRLRKHLDQFGESHSLSQRTVFKMNLALEELVSNIISYGYPDDDDHWIKVVISFIKGVLVISLEDDGIPFNPVEDYVLATESLDLGRVYCVRGFADLSYFDILSSFSVCLHIYAPESGGRQKLLCSVLDMISS